MDGDVIATRTGETLEGRYHLDRHLADDGPSEVYAATDTQAGSAVVVRLLRPEHVLRPRAVESFVTLPNALVKLSPPHVARVFAVASDDTGIPYVVEEAPQGQTLAEVLAAHPDGLPAHEAKQILGPVIEAFARLHMAGVVHGQLSPRRILLMTHAGQAMPRLIHHCVTTDETGAFASYTAPEHRSPKPPAADATMDVWSLAVLIHHVFSGRLPPAEPTTKQLQQRMPELPTAMAAAISEGLCVAPDERVSDAAVLWMRLESAFQQIAAPAATSVAHTAEPDPATAHVSSPVAATNVATPAAAPSALPIAETSPPYAETPSEKATVASPPPAGNAKPARSPIAHLPGIDPTPRQNTAPKAAPAAATSASPTIGTQGRTRTPGAVNEAQLRYLLALNNEDEHRAWPWIRVALLLLLLLLFWRAVPMLIEPDFAAARRVFGPQLKIAAIVLAVVSVGALFATRALLAHGSALVTRPVAYVSRTVVLCICVIVGGALWWGGFADPALGGGVAARGGAGWRMAMGTARTVLPYAMTLLLTSGALMGLMHGLRSLRDSMALAIAALVLAAGGGAVSVDLAVSTIQPSLAKLRDKTNGKDDGAPDDTVDIARVKQAFKPRKIEIGADSTPDDLGSDPKVLERTSVGDEGDTDMMGDDMKRQRARQMDLIRSAEKELPTSIPR